MQPGTKKIEPEQLFDEIRQLMDGGDVDKLRRCLHEAGPADLAEVVELLGDDQQHMFMALLDADEAGEVLSMVDEATRGGLVDDMTGQALTDLVATMPPDDAADFLAELPSDQSEDVLEHLPPDQAAEVASLLQYAEDTAGGLMTPEYVSITEDMTVSDVVTQLREMELDDEDEEPFFIYVVDDVGRLTGLVPLRKLILVRPETAVTRIMTRDLVTLSVDDDQEEVVNVFRRTDLPAIPVLDRQGRLIGRITHDDVADAIFEEADEDMYRMAGTDASELERASALRAARVRMTWLLPCLVGTMLTGIVMAAFETQIDVKDFTLLVLFVPMIAAMGGNSGVQASTIIIRGLATQEMAGQSVSLAFRREAPIAAAVGVVCGGVAGIVALGVAAGMTALGREQSGLGPGSVGIVVGLAMLVAIHVAMTLGTFLPFVFRSVGIDPAIASGPLITTANDILSVAIYLGIGLGAIALLSG